MSHSLIFLVGYRGAGKTAVGQALARRLGWDWIDADVLFEERHGITIKQIFETEGEAGFRDKEAALLQDLSLRERCVIATGGGVILREANRKLLSEAGFIVWLQADCQTLWRRIQQDSATGSRRPDLAGGGLAEVEQLLRTREPLYRSVAHLTIATEEQTTEEIAEALVRQIGEAGT